MRKDKVILNGKNFYRHSFFTDYVASKFGEIFSLKRKKLLKCSKASTGYLVFTLYQDGNQMSYYVHRFVFECIKGVIPKKFHVDHLDNCKANNSIYNLQLLTPRENTQKSCNKKVVSINLETREENIFASLKIAGEELGIKKAKYLRDLQKAKTS